uniref:Uncharacterized protein n=1 Tax=Peronospora matthiolae TaxID=2874970 RepID=A0AAV1ULL2_9STRA
MSDDDVASTIGDAVDESATDPSDFNLEAFLGEVINAPRINPAKSIKYDFNAAAGTAYASGLVKPNHYTSLRFEDADPDSAR